MGGRPSQMGTHPSLDLSSFLLRTSPTGQPIYEEIPNSLGPLLPSSGTTKKSSTLRGKTHFTFFSDSCSDYVDTTSGYHSLESETGPFLLPLTRYNKRLLTCFFLHDYHHLLIVDMFLSIIMSLLLYMMTCSGLQLCPAT